jgi:hypothetical protein
MADEGGRIELTYPVHYLEDGRTVCGHSLARELIGDALRLLIGMHGRNLRGAWDEFETIADAAAQSLDEHIRAGKEVGFVIRADLVS